jgi:hypothetical protein
MVNRIWQAASETGNILKSSLKLVNNAFWGLMDMIKWT